MFLLPPDMRDWLADDHLVWFVIDLVAQLDTTVLHQRKVRAWSGPRRYDPDMLLALLIYGYCQGQRSSRRIEALCEVDVAFRLICAGDRPDHATLARFRRTHLAQFTVLFEQVLALCAAAGMVKLGTVAIDGTKIAANASAGANRSEDWLREQAERITAEAEAADAAEDDLFGGARGDELPEDLRDPCTRADRIRAAAARAAADRAAREADAVAREQARRDYLDRVRAGEPVKGRAPSGVDPVELAQARVQGQIARAQARQAAWQAKADAAAALGHRLPGTAPDPPEQARLVRRAEHALHQAEQAPPTQSETGQAEQAARKAPRYNITDPDSCPQPTRNGWIQGFNAQLAVTADWIVLAATLGRNTEDVGQFVPMMNTAVATAERLTAARPGHANEPDNIGLLLADAGYLSTANITAPGPDRLIATGKHHDLDRQTRIQPASGPPPEDASPLDKMRHRLRTPAGATAYKARGATVETVNAHLKDGIGLRRFSMRGLTACTAELHLAAACANLLKLWRAAPALTP